MSHTGAAQAATNVEAHTLRVAANDNLMDIIDAAVYLGVSPSHLSRHEHLLPTSTKTVNGRAVWSREDIESVRGSIPPEDQYWMRKKDGPKKRVVGAKGSETQFWRHIDKRSDTEWIWTGRTNNNHNTVDTESYDYGVFALGGHDTELVHRIMVEKVSGRKLSRTFDVFHFDGNHLNIHPDNLGVRNVHTRQEYPASMYAAVNDNAPALKVAA